LPRTRTPMRRSPPTSSHIWVASTARRTPRRRLRRGWASTPDAALGEAFQVDRTIDRVLDSPYLTGLSFTRPLTVLDLATDSAGAWATRVGGTFAVSAGPHTVTQHWARTSSRHFPTWTGCATTAVRRRAMSGAISAGGNGDAGPAETIRAAHSSRPGTPHRGCGTPAGLQRRVSPQARGRRTIKRRLPCRQRRAGSRGRRLQS
jgi:hypothetical protein